MDLVALVDLVFAARIMACDVGMFINTLCDYCFGGSSFSMVKNSG